MTLIAYFVFATSGDNLEARATREEIETVLVGCARGPLTLAITGPADSKASADQ